MVQKSFKVIEGGQRVQFGMWWAKYTQGDEVRELFCSIVAVCTNCLLLSHNMATGPRYF